MKSTLVCCFLGAVFTVAPVYATIIVDFPPNVAGTNGDQSYTVNITLDGAGVASLVSVIGSGANPEPVTTVSGSASGAISASFSITFTSSTSAVLANHPTFDTTTGAFRFGLTPGLGVGNNYLDTSNGAEEAVRVLADMTGLSATTALVVSKAIFSNDTKSNLSVIPRIKDFATGGEVSTQILDNADNNVRNSVDISSLGTTLAGGANGPLYTMYNDPAGNTKGYRITGLEFDIIAVVPEPFTLGLVVVSLACLSFGRRGKYNV